jgi:hypothetical protein
VVFLAALHCTAGDVAIAAVAPLAALLLLGWTWPAANFLRVAIATVVLAVTYTIFSESLNTQAPSMYFLSPDATLSAVQCADILSSIFSPFIF